MINRATDLVEEGRYRSPFGYILVDESQDISPSRARLLKALLDSSPGSQLSAVGDDWQAIYRFGGSDIAVMREFGDHFGAFERIDLPTTFRCVDRIATVATIEQAPLLGVRMGLPPHVEHFVAPVRVGQSRAGQGQEPKRRHVPRAIPDPPVEHRAESRELVFVEIAGDGLLRVLGDVGAGVGNVLAEFAPFPRLLSKALKMSNVRLAAPGLSALAASNHAETRAGSMVSSLSRPNAASRRRVG